jgi:DNA (cytosine-5)-methyltransferase 1
MAPVDPHAMTFGSLFAGIGGFDLGLERAGMVCKWQVEIDPWCRKVLTKHWPHVPKYEDVREVGAHNLERVDLLCGGFPCQDASLGQTQWGKRTGIDGSRTGLWREIARLADEIRPRVLLLENVPGLLSAGFGRVLGDVAALGFNAEWRCIPASKAGFPHRRDRLWIVAYAGGERLSGHYEGASLLESAEASFAQHGDEAAGAWRALDGHLDSLRGGDGVSVAVERRRIGPLGNTIVPQIAESIGRRILEAVQ